MQKFDSFSAFYPYYLREHANPWCRLMHYIGSTLVLLILAWILLTDAWFWLISLPVIGYGFAWFGHLVFEHNKPATFHYPWYSLAADWVMYKDFLTGQLSGKLASAAIKQS
ncbi:hypothetical protein GCM10010919_11460 [Alishewanella longhuensis]|uniref:DUF962 domain-containing protein n=1 Tax=Alishewanella longhuensis TaxID=1091037 RepID=A0ABQ3KWY4_9ALTE|nr:DUF962 domain-containing protein [Alishewanella longhuensis]GHG64697.1 hypothetical protein GCM10010919_11460 [Alishewanella longhuensis]